MLLTHTYHPDYGPFGNICDHTPESAATLLADLNRNGVRRTPLPYLERRLETEEWLVRAARGKICGVHLARPRYLFLGDFTDGLDPARPASILLPLAALPPESLTFTYPDSMTSHLVATRSHHMGDRNAYHGQVFTLEEIRAVVAAIGLPKPSFPRAAGALSQGYIEVQLWDVAPLRPWLESGSL